MSWTETPFEEILISSRDGEWGKGENAVGLRRCLVIRGTDFAEIDNPSRNFQKRWIKTHIVDRKRLQPGDIILEAAGGTAKQSTGRTALLKSSFFERTEQPILCASFSRHLRLKPEFSSEFIYYLLQSLYRSGYMAVYNIQHTGVSRFQYTSFKKHTKLLLPHVKNQCKIAAILTAYDDLIETNKRRIALLEKMAEELYREWFVRMRFPGHQDTRFVKGVPEGWEVRELQDCADINPSSLGRNDHLELIHYVDIGSVTTNQIGDIKAIPLSEAPGRAKRRVKHGDIIWSSVRPANRAYCLIYEPVENMIVSTGFAVIRPKAETPFTFLNFTVTSNGFVDLMTAVAKGSAYPATSFEDFGKFKLLWPGEDLLWKSHKVCEPFFRQKHTLIQKNVILAKTRDLLLPRLISGKLSVENLDIQFPPSMRDEAEEPEAADA